jgi:hypothetical protein
MQAEREGLLNACAVLVQKTARGFVSRRVKHDFYSRKSYVPQHAFIAANIADLFL